MLYTDLKRHQKLAVKRHPMYERNRFGKFLIYFGVGFWISYLLFFGVMFTFMFEGLFPNMEPYHIMNQGLIYLLFIDFLFRFVFQKTPAQEMKPYLLLPIKKNKLLNIYLLQSGLSSYNLLWLAMLLPFALLTITKFYGLQGVVLYCLGIWLLMVFNNYWYLFCRILINEKIYFIFIPVLFYGLAGGSEFLFDHPVSTFTMDLGEVFITGNIWAFTGVLLALLIMAGCVRILQIHYIYDEQAKIKDTKVKHISEYKFLERYGEVGEYLRLELKLIFRNKSCKIAFRMGCLAILLFSIALFFDIYSGPYEQSFVLAYNFAILGVMLNKLMSFEGNYMDGLMSRKESIYNLLKAKYYFYCMVALFPFLLMVPAMIMGKVTFLAVISYMFLAIGPVYCMLFQLAVYNKKSTPLNDTLSAKNSGGSAYQTIISSLAFFLPMMLNALLTPFLGAETTQWIFLVTGILVVLTSPFWIRNVYNRFMKRRYENMEGFRDSR